MGLPGCRVYWLLIPVGDTGTSVMLSHSHAQFTALFFPRRTFTSTRGLCLSFRLRTGHLRKYHRFAHRCSDTFSMVIFLGLCDWLLSQIISRHRFLWFQRNIRRSSSCGLFTVLYFVVLWYIKTDMQTQRRADLLDFIRRSLPHQSTK